jgi:hypothetical protein
LVDVYKTSNDAVIRSRTTGAGAYVYLDSATDGWYGINMLSGSTSRWFVGSYGTSDFTITRGLGSSEYVRVTTTGNVGIGTTSPSAKLQVVGTANVIELVQATTGSATYYVMDNTVETGGKRYRFGYSGASSDKGSFTIYNQTDNITPFTITTSGNVGIGTTNPGSKLQINDNTPTLTIRANDGGTSRKAYIDFYTTFYNYPSDVGARRTSTIVTGFADGTYGTWGTEFLAFNVGSGSANDAALLPIERVRIDGSGNVGIGTISASAKLQVAGNISGSSFTSSVSNAVGFLGTSSWAQNVVSSSYATTAQTANALNSANSYTITNLTASGVVKASQIAEKVVTFTPLTGSITGAPAWYRIISGSGVLDSGRVRMSANYDNSRSDIEFTYAVRNYDTDGGRCIY